MTHFFVHRYMQLTGDTEEDILSYTLRPALRINTLKISDKELINRLRKRGVTLEKIPFLSHGYWYTAPFSLGATQEYLLGYYYLQEAASQLPIQAVEQLITAKNINIIDLAAAPGSKTTQLGALLKNKGSIVAVDANRNRLQSLANNLERCGVSNTFVYHADAGNVQTQEKFDIVLLDAPCSGNMTLQKNWMKKRSMYDPKEKSKIQSQLLLNALHLLENDGILLYSTCSLEVEENELLLDSTLPNNYKIIDLQLKTGTPGTTVWKRRPLREDLSHSIRMWPHIHGTQGFFLAGITKKKE